MAETTKTFYPDAHPEVTSVDGSINRCAAPWTWAGIHDGTGTTASDNGATDLILIRAADVTDWWYQIYRLILLYDTSSIPPGSTILGAELGAYGTGGRRDWTNGFYMGVYTSFPLSNTALVTADYQRLNAVPLCAPISYNDWQIGSYNRFTFFADKLGAITPGGITKLGLREAQFDAPDGPPSWKKYGWFSMSLAMADSPYPDRRPYLKVTYLAGVPRSSGFVID